MTQRSMIHQLARFTLLILAVSAPSLFADDRPKERTRPIQAEVDHRGDLEGIVAGVSRDGDEILLRTPRGRVRVDANRGVRVWYRGERFRVRDLERGDRIAVDLISKRGRLRAREIHVLASVSDRGFRQDDRWRRERDRSWDRRDDGNDRDFADDRDRDAGRVSGRIVSLDGRVAQMTIRTSSGRNVIVDTRLLERRYGSSWARSLRAGEWIELEGEFDGWTFVAESVERSGSR